jgi:hypothetical protein
MFGALGVGSLVPTGLAGLSVWPIDVVGLGGTPLQVSAGAEQSCAILVGATVRCWGANSHGQIGDGSQADRTQPVDVLIDDDSDGCLNVTELGPTAPYGGMRNPKDRWDFFDVPVGAPPARDRVVSGGDIAAVVARFGTFGDPGGDPLAPAPPAPAYHTAFDRGGMTPGSDLWDLLPPNGSISSADIGAVVAQFGHSCA